MGDMDTGFAVTSPLQAIFASAKQFGLTDDEIWSTLDESVRAVGYDGTVGECLDDLTAALARRILAAARGPAR
jgi:hypothetical protein